MFKSNVKYTNRYKDTYTWTKQTDNTFEFVMEGDGLKYCRCGGREGVDEINYQDLRMFDPSGGPYVQVGDLIDGKTISRLFETTNGFGAEVEC